MHSHSEFLDKNNVKRLFGSCLDLATSPLPRDKDLRFLITTTMESIQVRTKYIEPAEPGLPALAVQIMRLVDSYMIWVGITEETAETVADAPRGGMLCRDWACAMPPASRSAVSCELRGECGY